MESELKVDWLRHRNRSARMISRFTDSSGAPAGTDGVRTCAARDSEERPAAVNPSASRPSPGAGAVSAIAARISSASTLFRSVGRSIAASTENKGGLPGMQPKHSARAC